MLSVLTPADVGPWALAIAGAITTIGGAFIGLYILAYKAWSQSHANGKLATDTNAKVTALSNGVGIQQVKAGTTEVLAQAGLLDRRGGGGAKSLGPTNQLTEVTVSLTPSPTRDVDCGPSCVAWMIRAITGVYTAAELMRLNWFNVIDNRLTNVYDIAGMMSQNGRDCTTGFWTKDDFRTHVQSETRLGHLVCALGDWVSPGVGHWVVFYRADDNGATFMNPYGGQTETQSWAWIATRLTGDAVTTKETR